MLPAINRLKKRKDFENVFKNGQNTKAPFLVLKTSKNKLTVNRFGFVVSQKVSKNAVVRNKVRRRLGNITSHLEGLKKGSDFVFIALPGIQKKEFLEIKNIVLALIKKLAE